ncbi:PREDICTED: protein-glutamate O-methyltransferase-like [Nicrophorus vespilloides]|uniref:Sugar phosphate phosphatase n=1 Tax=Nicrophorus vespilloides TaxID=110193 RepID=A0ABM1M6L6_NICVS|nr:PREDICTED: protein-glutamate O-methyltransferase-like [Nicrophorus vespilloides]
MDECHCVNFPGEGVDIKTPRNEYLSAFFKRSYANHTVKVRMPIIITKIIDSLVRNKEEITTIHGLESAEDLKHVIGELSKLKYEIQTNKEIVKLKSTEPDAVHYNKVLKYHNDQNATCSYFNVLWLFAECYMYRRIKEMFEETVHLQKFDPFREDKRSTFFKGKEAMIYLGQFLLDILSSHFRNDESDFKELLKINMWGNKCDLSHTNGDALAPTLSLIECNKSLSKNLLCDMSNEVWLAANVESRYQFIDVVLDNCGYELFTDLCIADFLCTKNIAERVRFYVKTIPWFLSDVMKKDLEWLVDQCADSEDDVLRNLGSRWKTYLEDDFWTIEEHDFWTTPLEYKHMFKVDESLYRKLARAKLIIFKGDLNYRKLFGERSWDPTTSIEHALGGFFPSRICSLRTLKSESICGLNDNAVKKAENEDSTWMISGNYGVIQYCGNNMVLI